MRIGSRRTLSMHQFLLDGDLKSLDCVKDVTLSASVLCDCQKWELRQLPSPSQSRGNRGCLDMWPAGGAVVRGLVGVFALRS